MTDIKKWARSMLAGVFRKTVDHVVGAGMGLGAMLSRQAVFTQNKSLHNRYEVECVGPDGRIKWKETIDNLVVDVGLDDVLDKYYKGSGYTASFFVLLTDSTPTVAAGDTMASHVGWVEITAYSEATRPALTLGTVASQSVDNSASKASYSVNADSTVIGGAGVTDNNTKGGATGLLVGAGAFTGGDKSADNGDTLNVTATLTASSS